MGALSLPEHVDNSIYETYGDRWYTAYDDPVALLRAATRAKLPWILARTPAGAEILDVACGAGFVSNPLARAGHRVTGLDLSVSSLAVARRWDATGKARYVPGDARNLPFPDATFDAVTCLDFLEHVEDPGTVLRECARVLKPGGLLFYSTLNRSFLSWLVGIKFVEWFVRNTPPRMHLHRLFLKPGETARLCREAGLEPRERTGIRPRFRTIPLTSWFRREVPPTLEFRLTRSTALLYLATARKT